MPQLLLALSCATGCAPSAEQPWYADSDGDGYGVAAYVRLAAEVPRGYSSVSGDCNDDDASVFPGASEVCDGLDNDCDGGTDEGLLVVLYADADGDGFGADELSACPGAEGASQEPGDCDDSSALVHPGAAEVCGDGLDNDCAGDGDSRCLLSGDLDAGVGGLVLYGDVEGDELGAELVCPSGRTSVDPYLLVSESRGGRALAGFWVLDSSGVSLPGQPRIDDRAVELTAAAEGEFRDGTGAIPGPDLDGDGIPDILFGGDALYAAPLPTAAAGLGDFAFLELVPPNDSLNLGRSGAVLGDTSVFVAGPGNVFDGSWGSDVGAGYVLSGPLSGTLAIEAVADAAIGPPVAHERGYFGMSSCGGDLDGDGVNDLAVGSPALYSSTYPEFMSGGSVYILYGPVTSDFAVADDDGSLLGADARLEAGGEVAGLGLVVDCTGDIDGDGTIDGLAGAPMGSSGAAFVFGGSEFGVVDTVDLEIAFTSDDDDQFGYDLSSGGDVDGDGFDDVAVVSSTGDGTGIVHLFYGPLTGMTSASLNDASFTTGQSGDYYYRVEMCPDMDGDGFGDLFMGAKRTEFDGAQTGALYAVFGGGD